MMTDTQFGDMLSRLSHVPGLRVCGSQANGTGQWNSDLDFACLSRKAFDTAVEIVREFNVPLESVVIGQLSSPRDLVTLPIPIELMETAWLKPTPKRFREVAFEFGGVRSEFKTY